MSYFRKQMDQREPLAPKHHHGLTPRAAKVERWQREAGSIASVPTGETVPLAGPNVVTVHHEGAARTTLADKLLAAKWSK